MVSLTGTVPALPVDVNDAAGPAVLARAVSDPAASLALQVGTRVHLGQVTIWSSPGGQREKPLSEVVCTASRSWRDLEPSASSRSGGYKALRTAGQFSGSVARGVSPGGIPSIARRPRRRKKTGCPTQDFQGPAAYIDQGLTCPEPRGSGHVVFWAFRGAFE